MPGCPVLASAHQEREDAELKDFKQFLLRGNIVDLAVAVVIGLAFAAVVSALVDDLLTPLIAAIFGKHDFAALTFTVNNSRFLYGAFFNALIAFVAAAAIFFFVVKPVTAMVPGPQFVRLGGHEFGLGVVGAA